VTAKQICKVFESELKLTKIDPDDDFFDLGGDSLMAENIVLSLQNLFQVELQTSVLLSAASPNQLAILIQAIKNTNAPSQLITKLETNNPQFTALMVHGKNGSSLFASRLGPKFKSLATILAVRGHGTQPGEIPLLEGEQIVEDYLNAATRCTDGVPDIFGGICTGGLIALAIGQKAYQLTGKKPLIIMIDPPEPGRGWLKPTAKRISRRRARIIFYKFLLSIYDFLILSNFNIAKKVRRKLFKMSLMSAFEKYDLKGYPCDILIMASEHRSDSINDYLIGMPEDTRATSHIWQGGHSGFQQTHRDEIDNAIFDFLTDDVSRESKDGPSAKSTPRLSKSA